MKLPAAPIPPALTADPQYRSALDRIETLRNELAEINAAIDDAIAAAERAAEDRQSAAAQTWAAGAVPTRRDLPDETAAAELRRSRKTIEAALILGERELADHNRRLRTAFRAVLLEWQREMIRLSLPVAKQLAEMATVENVAVVRCNGHFGGDVIVSPLCPTQLGLSGQAGGPLVLLAEIAVVNGAVDRADAILEGTGFGLLEIAARDAEATRREEERVAIAARHEKARAVENAARKKALDRIDARRAKKLHESIESASW